MHWAWGTAITHRRSCVIRSEVPSATVPGPQGPTGMLSMIAFRLGRTPIHSAPSGRLLSARSAISLRTFLGEKRVPERATAIDCTSAAAPATMAVADDVPLKSKYWLGV